MLISFIAIVLLQVFKHIRNRAVWIFTIQYLRIVIYRFFLCSPSILRIYNASKLISNAAYCLFLCNRVDFVLL